MKICFTSIMQDWESKLEFFCSSTYNSLQSFLLEEKKAGKSILPPEDLIFNSLISTPFDKVKVVIVGQDPYPNARHAHGLSFSIPKQTKDIPKSLKNIIKEMETDCNETLHHGNLQHWAKQGVLLLNRC